MILYEMTMQETTMQETKMQETYVLKIFFQQILLMLSLLHVPPPNDNKDVTPTAQSMDARAALKKAASIIKVSKTKNSSNKNNERTSVMGAIVKLIA
jgi:hypothetical protein